MCSHGTKPLSQPTGHPDAPDTPMAVDRIVCDR